MRVILKPAGLFCLVGAFGVLTAVAVQRVKPSTRVVAVPLPAPGSASSDAGSPAAAASPSARATPAPVWGKPKHVLEPDIASQNWRLLISGGAEAKVDVVPASVPGHPFARRVSASKVTSQHWDVQIAHPLEKAFRKGQHLRLTFWARSPQSSPVAAVVEQASAPYTKLNFKKYELSPEWRQFTEEWDQPDDTPPSWAEVDFQAAYQPGVIEVTGVEIFEMEQVGP